MAAAYYGRHARNPANYELDASSDERWLFKFPRAAVVRTPSQQYCEESAVLHAKGERYARRFNAALGEAAGEFGVTINAVGVVQFAHGGQEHFCLAERVLEPPSHFLKYSTRPHTVHCHAVHLPLGALLSPCTVYGAGTTATTATRWRATSPTRCRAA